MRKDEFLDIRHRIKTFDPEKVKKLGNTADGFLKVRNKRGYLINKEYFLDRMLVGFLSNDIRLIGLRIHLLNYRRTKRFSKYLKECLTLLANYQYHDVKLDNRLRSTRFL